MIIYLGTIRLGVCSQSMQDAVGVCLTGSSTLLYIGMYLQNMLRITSTAHMYFPPARIGWMDSVDAQLHARQSFFFFSFSADLSCRLPVVSPVERKYRIVCTYLHMPCERESIIWKRTYSTSTYCTRRHTWCKMEITIQYLLLTKVHTRATMVLGNLERERERDRRMTTQQGVGCIYIL